MQDIQKSRVYHPVLFAINFPMMVISSNLGVFSLLSIALVLLATLLATGIVWYSLQRIIGNVHISAVFTSLSLAVFYTYGHILILLWIAGLGFISDAILLAIIAFLFLIVGLSAWKYANVFQKFSRALNFLAVILVASYFITFAITFNGKDEYPEVRIQPVQVEGSATGYEEVLPDVYLIVLDAYPRQDVYETLAAQDAFFEDELEALGFTIATDSKSNYLFTQATLASVLNFDYIPSLLGDEFDPDREGLVHLGAYVQENAVCETFKSIGYRVVTHGSAHDKTCADEVLTDYAANSKLASIYINTTILRPFFVGSLLADLQEFTIRVFDHIITVSEMDEPTFMFAHVLLPHTPFVFDQDGKLPADEVNQLTFAARGTGSEVSANEEEAFIDQTIYTAKITLETINQILENSDVPPIIIIMSDHGPDFNKIEYNEAYYAQRVPTLTAFYVPNGGESAIYDSITPVNFFRVIFNYYFSAELDLLEDRLYITEFGDNIYYNYQDITTRTLAKNDDAHIGVDWDGNFYEIAQFKDDRRYPVLRIDIETILDTGETMVEASNGWDVILNMEGSALEITVIDSQGDTIIQTQIQSPDDGNRE